MEHKVWQSHASPNSNRPLSLAQYVAVSICLSALVMHFTATGLAQVPLTAAGIRYARVLNNEFHSSFFQQQWRLFAPEPPLANYWLEVSCRYKDGSESAWLATQQESSMLRPSGYLARISEAATRWLLSPFTDKHSKIVESSANADADFLARAHAMVRDLIRRSHRSAMSAHKLAVHYCRLYRPSEVAATRCRVLHQEITPYSQRHRLAEEPVTATEFPWVDVATLEDTHLQMSEEQLEAETCKYFEHILKERFHGPGEPIRALAAECDGDRNPAKEGRQ